MVIHTNEKNKAKKEKKGGVVLDGQARRCFLDNIMFYFGCLGTRWSLGKMGSDC